MGFLDPCYTVTCCVVSFHVSVSMWYIEPSRSFHVGDLGHKQRELLYEGGGGLLCIVRVAVSGIQVVG